MKKIAFAAALLALSASGAFACTTDELTQKAQTFATKLTALAQKDAKKAQEISQKVQAESSQVKSLDDSCKKYDEWTAIIDKAM